MIEIRAVNKAKQGETTRTPAPLVKALVEFKFFGAVSGPSFLVEVGERLLHGWRSAWNGMSGAKHAMYVMQRRVADDIVAHGRLSNRPVHSPGWQIIAILLLARLALPRAPMYAASTY